MTHEDSRRTLTSIPYEEGEIKIIVVKEDCELGNHYHKIKTEDFQLIQGSGIAKVDGFQFMLVPQRAFRVEPLQPHSFFLEKGSILFCICSHPYDNTDDYGL